ncbi:MAG: hypothetical protein KAU95_04740, partial [Candidatus Aenigmarchaeota archaeon]|nr:hypothetical protein [Candidatus Aenigmarchaeota archaeon]
FYDGIEATCPDGHIGVGAGSNFEYVWEIPFSFDDSDYIYDNIKIAALAYDDYYGGGCGSTYCGYSTNYSDDSVWTKNNPEKQTCETYYHRTFWDKSDPDIYHKVEVFLDKPTGTKIAKYDDANDTDARINFTCIVEAIVSGYYVHDVPVNFTCEGCNVSENQGVFNGTTNNNGEATFTLDFENESGLGYYNFTCAIPQNHSWLRAFPPNNTDTSEITIVKYLGTVDGPCDFDGVCEDNETCVVCPSDCGYEKLPEDYCKVGGAYYNNTTEECENTSMSCGCSFNGICKEMYEITSSCVDCTGAGGDCIPDDNCTGDENCRNCKVDCGGDKLPSEFWVNNSVVSAYTTYPDFNESYPTLAGQVEDFLGTTYSWYYDAYAEGGITKYENESFCGCNFNETCEDRYECIDLCADCLTPANQPPEVKDNWSSSYWVKPSGTNITI